MSRPERSGARHSLATFVRSFAAACLVATVFLFSGVAQAAPLSAVSLDQLHVYTACMDRCALGRVATKPQCEQSCGIPQAGWNKNDDAAVNRRDYQLAMLEFWDAGSLQKICYEGDAVVPKGKCGGSDCSASHTAAECADQDHDGIKSWQETLAGTSDNTAQTPCDTGLECNGFAEQCWYESVLDVSYCKARSSQTAFHLEKIEESAEEVTLALVFDYSPLPPTILDLYLSFNGSALSLSESRALAAAKAAGKDVQVRQVGDNLLRIIVLGAGDARTIEPGRVAELVFRRKTGDPSIIQFSNDQAQREKSVAPTPGAFGLGLRADSAWGGPIQLKNGADPSEGRTLLQYDFDSQERPLSLSNAMAAPVLCDQVRLASGSSTLAGDCPTEPGIPAGGASDPQYAAAKLRRDRWITQLTALQSGSVVTTRAVDGVTGSAAWFDGENDHVEFPLTFNQPPSAGGSFAEAQQSYSLSFWVFREPSSDTSGEEVLYSRNAQGSEATQFALLARPNATQTDKFDLVWLSGPLTGGTGVRTVMRDALPNRKWTHIGISVVGSTRVASVLVDGQPAGSVTLSAGALVSCPIVDPAFSKRMTIHQEGDFVGVKGTGPEGLFFAASGSNGLFGIEASDTNGLGRRALLRLAEGSAQDPDYNPYVDRLVYSSNASGNSEIWLARGDGSQAQRISSGFGSTADGVFARHPRWAPDGSGIVFESNAHDIDRLDNVEGLGSQLYYIPYDATKNAIAIPGPNNTVLSELNYAERVGAGDIGFYRLTRATESDNNTGARWLAGKTGSGDLALGDLAFTATDANGANPRVRRVRVAMSFMKGVDANKQLLSFTADPALVQNRSLLAARATRAAGQPTVEKALLASQQVTTRPASEFSATIAANGTCSNGALAYSATIRYLNAAVDPQCWDSNKNHACDLGTEDRNADQTCDPLDCNLSEFDSLFVNYDRTKSVPDMTAALPGSWVVANDKKFRAAQVFGSSDSVRLELTSPINNKPIPTNTVVATLQFCGAQSPVLELKKQRIEQSFYLLSSTVDEQTPANNQLSTSPFVLHDNRIQSVVGAEFSPDLKRLALALTFDARPTLFRTRDLLGTEGADQIVTDPVRIEGISWSGVERLYSCNWVGAVRHPTSKLYQAPFQGAIDDLRLVDFARTEGGFAAESERGHERLQKEGRDGATQAQGKSCAIDLDCSTGDLCVTGKCQRVSCNPADTYACARGRCQRLPVELAPTEEYACVAECLADSGCLEKQCASGPCRFCDATARTCSECRNVVEDVGGLKLEYIQGCPDRNSFACDRGTCVSACYAQANGQSKYLCDSATEYCRAGRCVLFDWNWGDTAPMSFAGAGEMVSHNIKATAAISQLYPVRIQALGVADQAHPPELLVEGKATGVFGGEWFDIGRIVVDNETKTEALARPYVLNSPYPLTNLRLRTILPPYENLTKAAMGLLNGRGGEFCTAAQGDKCRLAATGSRAMLGYESWISGHLSKCKRSPGECDEEQNKFLGAGTPVALVLGIKIKDQEQPLNSWVNRICPYWNGTESVAEPVEPSTGRPNWLIYGDASREISNQKTFQYPNAPASSLLSFTASTRGFGVLNCNYVEDLGSVANIAALELPISNVSYAGVGAGPFVDAAIRETANGCTIDMGTPSAPSYQACYEWDGADVSFDPFGSQPQAYRTLTIDHFSSFGWGNPGDDKP